jgi:hypothetical protein
MFYYIGSGGLGKMVHDFIFHGYVTVISNSLSFNSISIMTMYFGQIYDLKVNLSKRFFTVRSILFYQSRSFLFYDRRDDLFLFDGIFFGSIGS